MTTKEKLNEKFFTKDGLEFIETKIKTMIELCNNNKFPIRKKLYGFGSLNVNSQEEMVGRILELCELIGFKINVQKIEIDDKEKYLIKWQE